MEKIDFRCEFKLAPDGSMPGKIDGYASVFNVVDGGGDMVMPGAFKGTLQDWKRKGQMVPMLWQHDPDEPIGVWDSLSEDEQGLKASGTLILDVPQAAAVRALVKGGAVSGLSIGYQTKDYTLDRNSGVRKLNKVDLWEVSLVTFPMCQEAQVSGIKANIGIDPTEWEKAFRDEGLSKREAAIATSVARKLALRDAVQPQHAGRDDMVGLLNGIRKLGGTIRA